MKFLTLRTHAVAFAACLGMVAFVLAFFSAAADERTAEWLANATIIAAACAVLSWGAANRLIAMISDAISAAAGRLAAAAAGDLVSPTPDTVSKSLPDLSRSIDTLVGRVRDELETANSLAQFDAVTALPNRVYFRKEADAALGRFAGRAALLFIDLDNFKAVNDSLGHAAGDQLLIMIANRLRALVSSGKIAADVTDPVLGRFAGDEFTLFLGGQHAEAAADSAASRILAALDEPFAIAGQEVRVGASIGIAIAPQHGASLPQLMRAADVAMYDAKDSGRGRVHRYNEALAEKLALRNRLDHELRHGFANDQFDFEFQPQVRLADGAAVVAEALLRWHHPTGTRTPRAFLRAAEDIGVLNSIGDWAMDRLAATAGRWNREGRATRLAINLTARQFVQGGLYERTVNTLATHGAPLSMLEIEVADSIAMEAGEALLQDLAKLRNDGAIITIDNFGRNAVHISRLRAMPFTRVKLDRSLVRDIATDGGSRAILQSCITMLNAIGCDSIATGVETDAQLDVLRIAGCRAAQGFAIARPMGDAALGVWLAREAAPLRLAG
jgi:diguanylate cyclase